MFDFFLAPFVIARRMEQLSTPAAMRKSRGGPVADAVEMQRMVAEKVAATQLGMLGSSAAMLSSATTFTGRMMQGDALGAAIVAADAPRKAVAAGLQPARAILKANVRRLKAM
jgi:hypothetical protein